ncbi:MAG: sporulation/spore germination protein [Paenibacillaceae bacterium]|nr:sporulation/spore germination protein [Paenibacillaceae bacterium]
MKSIAASLLLLTLAAGCQDGTAPAVTGTIPAPAASVAPSAATASPAASAAGTAAPASAGLIRQQVEAAAAKAVTALKERDWAALALAAHPDKGVRISPYTHVDTKQDIVLNREVIKQLQDDKAVRTWGTYDGSGEPIELTFAEFYEKFLYNHDYAAPEKTAYDEPIGKGNTANNIKEVYPGGHFVEYYFSGFDPKVQGMDWASLTLVFEQKDGSWFLTGLIRNQWTI